MKTQVHTFTPAQIAGIESVLKTFSPEKKRIRVLLPLEQNYEAVIDVYHPVDGEDDIGFLDPHLLHNGKLVAVDLSFHKSLVGDYVFHDGETRIDLRIEEES